ncbi:MAG: amino acid ABC transporter permease, partial [Actinobacteria bacterium]|nr:amino acid ABC transporter permease [Actinomycetota bacterium]
LLSAVGVMELMMFSKSLTANSGNVTPYIVAAGYYLLVTMPLIKVVSTFEAKLAQSEGSGPAGKDDGEGDGKRRKKRGWKPDAEDALAVSSATHESR